MPRYEAKYFKQVFLKESVKALSKETLRKICPVKWHDQIPEDGISLGVADVDFAGPEGVVPYIKDNLQDDFSFYQNQEGLPSAVDAAESYLSRLGARPEDRVQITEGTMMGISIAMQWAASHDGDIHVLGPLYEPIHRHATRHGNNLNWQSLKHNGFDHEVLKDQISDGIKMISICNPTNPTGYIFTREDLELIRDLAVDHDLYVFSDQLYAPLVFDYPFVPAESIPGLEDRVISLYGFSKAYGLAGYRAGFMYIGPDIDNVRHLASQYMVSPSPIASIVTEFALTDPNASQWVNDFREYSQEITAYASNQLNDIGIDTAKPQSCFFIYPYIEHNDVEFADYFLREYGVQTVPGSAFGADGTGHLRINCATSHQRLDDAFRRLEKALESFKKV